MIVSLRHPVTPSLRHSETPTSHFDRLRMKSLTSIPPEAPPPPRLVDPLRWGIYGGLAGLGAPVGLWVYLKVLDPLGTGALLQVVYLYTTVATSVVFATFGILAGRMMSKLRSASTHDALTGLANRRLLMGQLRGLLATGRRRGEPLCLLMLDLDHFKRVNDTYGHAVGDQTLIALARSLERDVRLGDLIARFGGEEFVVVCPNADEHAGVLIAERIRESVASLGEESLGFDGVQTISIGLSVSGTEGTEPLDLLTRADEALYEAKSSGRDKVCVYRPHPARPTDASTK